MTELQLYKFIQKNNIEIEWNGDELIIWIKFSDIQEFSEMLGYDHFCEGDMKVTLLFDDISFNIVPLCEMYNINPENILAKEKQQI